MESNNEFDSMKDVEYFLNTFKGNSVFNNDQYKELGDKYRSISEGAKNELIESIITSMKSIDGPNSDYEINIQLCHWFRTDISLGIEIAKGLDLDLSETMKQMPMM